MQLRKNKLAFIAIFLCFVAMPAKASLFAQANVTTIFETYSLVESANKKVESQRAKAERVFTTAQQEMEKLRKEKDQNKAFKKQKEIQAIVDNEISSIYDLQHKLDRLLTDNLNKAIGEVARKHSIEVVLDSAFVHKELPDLTKEIIALLESKYNKLLL